MTKIREGYKETEIGIIPEDWVVKDLSSICEVITKGTTPTTYGYEFVDEGINFVKIESVNDSYGVLRPELFSKIIDECHFKLNRSILENEDILFAIAGATVGKCAMIFEEHLPANTNQALAIIRLNDSEDKRFIFHQLRGYYVQHRINMLKTNTAQPNLNLKQIGEFKFAYPINKEEQQRIAEILSITDEHIEKLDKTIEDYQLLKKGMMNKLLTEGIGHTEFKETEIGRIPKDWEVMPIFTTGQYINGKAFKPIDWVNSGLPIIRIQNLSNPDAECNFFDGEIEEKYLVYNNDILFSWSGTLGIYRWRGGKACLNQHIYKVIPQKGIFGDYLMYQLDNSITRMAELSHGSTMKHITKKNLETFFVAIPSENEQKEIARILSIIDERLRLHSSEQKDFIQLKKALMEKLLTGKIRTI